ncbi:hypothetical protein [Chromobacterium sp. CV08]|uniref:hypothetical protein n=1 Tax=Chromobacterium sp. CV08 TaxID=3133274 RepID=UPI003DAA0D34
MTVLKSVCVASVIAAMLVGCAAPRIQVWPNMPDSRPYAAKVESKRPFRTARKMDFGPLTMYWLIDNRGVRTPVVSANPNYKVGQCVTLWRSRSGVIDSDFQVATYPKLSAANPNCSAPRQEPRSIDSYLYTREDWGYQWMYVFKMDNLWLGRTEDELLNSKDWGVPDKSYINGKTKYLTYTRASSEVRTDSANGVYSSSYLCETTFALQGGRVFNYQYRGNSCY